MSNSDKDPGLERLLTDTAAITVAAALLYFWGMIYYMTLCQSLGFAVSMFSIPFFDVLLVPWDSAVLALLVAIAIWLFWKVRAGWIFCLYCIVWLVVKLCKLTTRALLRISIIKTFAREAARIATKVAGALKAHTPSFLKEEIHKSEDAAVLRGGLWILVIIGVVVVADEMRQRAKASVVAFDRSTNRNQVEIVCDDDYVVRGDFVRAIGDSIVIEVHEDESKRRILVKSSEIKRTKIFPHQAPNKSEGLQ